MNFGLGMTKELRKVFLDYEGNSNKEKTEEANEEKDIDVKAPEAKDITASISDILAAQNVIMVSTNNKNKVPNGKYVVPNGQVVVHDNENGNIGFQFVGNGTFTLKELNKLIQKGLLPVENDEPNAQGINGEIDEPVSQGATGDCWILTGILSLTATKEGKALIKSSMEIQRNGDVIVNFKGLGYSIRVTAEEIRKHDTDDIKNDAFSNGDNDMLVFELAVQKLFEQHPDLKNAYYYEDGLEGDDRYITQGGFGNDLITWLSGNNAHDTTALDQLDDPYEKAGVEEWVTVPNSVIGYEGEEYPRPSSISYDAMFNSDKTNFSNEYINWYNNTFAPLVREYNTEAPSLLVKGLSEEEILEHLQEAYENQPCAITFGMYVFANDTVKTAKCVDGTTFTWKYYSNKTETGELCGHAFAVIGMTQDTITFVNPWDSTQEITMTWEEFAKLGVGRIAYNKLDATADAGETPEINEPSNDEINEALIKENTQKIQSLTQEIQNLQIKENLTDSEFQNLISQINAMRENAKSLFDACSKGLAGDGTSELEIAYKEFLQEAEKKEVLANESRQIDNNTPVEPTSEGYTNLRKMGFSKSDIEKYFVESDGVYTMRQDITYEYYENVNALLHKQKSIKEIVTIDDLRAYCGVEQRQALLKEGWTEDIIDKYFEQTPHMISGKLQYKCKFGTSPIPFGRFSGAEYQNKGYEISQNDNGETVITMKNKMEDEEIIITVKADGSYIEEHKKEPNVYGKESLLEQGFTEEQIKEYFEVRSSGNYEFKAICLSISDEPLSSYIEINSIEELRAYIGADSRVALKQQGLTDEMIDKYFELKRTGSQGESTYELKFEGNYTITEDGESKVLRIFNRENDTCTEIKINADGTTAEKTYSIIANGEEPSPVAASKDELLGQGFSQADLNEYFYQKNGQYFLKKGLSYYRSTDGVREKVEITTLDELKDYCGANQRLELKAKGLTDELIDKLYCKEQDYKSGKISYTEKNGRISFNNDDNNLILTINQSQAHDGSMEPNTIEIIVKPDGSYEETHYNASTQATTYRLKQLGFTDELINKYFDKTANNIYTLKDGFISPDGEVIDKIYELVDILKQSGVIK